MFTVAAEGLLRNLVAQNVSSLASQNQTDNQTDTGPLSLFKSPPDSHGDVTSSRTGDGYWRERIISALSSRISDEGSSSLSLSGSSSEGLSAYAVVNSL